MQHDQRPDKSEVSAVHSPVPPPVPIRDDALRRGELADALATSIHAFMLTVAASGAAASPARTSPGGSGGDVTQIDYTVMGRCSFTPRHRLLGAR